MATLQIRVFGLKRTFTQAFLRLPAIDPPPPYTFHTHTHGWCLPATVRRRLWYDGSHLAKTISSFPRAHSHLSPCIVIFGIIFRVFRRPFLGSFRGRCVWVIFFGVIFEVLRGSCFKCTLFPSTPTRALPQRKPLYPGAGAVGPTSTSRDPHHHHGWGILTAVSAITDKVSVTSMRLEKVLKMVKRA